MKAQAPISKICICTSERRCDYKPRRDVSEAGLPPPAYMYVACCSTENIQSNKEFIGMSKYTPGRERLTHVLLSQPLNTTTADASDNKNVK